MHYFKGIETANDELYFWYFQRLSIIFFILLFLEKEARVEKIRGFKE